jgi:hypothetical protein
MQEFDPNNDPPIDHLGENLAILSPKRSRPSGHAVGAVVGATLGFILCCSHVGPEEIFWTAGKGGLYTTPLGMVVFVVGGAILGTAVAALRRATGLEGQARIRSSLPARLVAKFRLSRNSWHG